MVEAEPPYNQDLSTEENSSAGLDDEVPIGLEKRIALTIKERRWVDGAYGGMREFLQEFGVTDPKEAKSLLKEIMRQSDDDEDITEGRLNARAIMKACRENKDPTKAGQLKEYAGLASMMLQAAPGNLNRRGWR